MLLRLMGRGRRRSKRMFEWSVNAEKRHGEEGKQEGKAGGKNVSREIGDLSPKEFGLLLLPFAVC